MSCYFPWGIMLWVPFLLQFIFHFAGGCLVEERISLMRIRSSLLVANSEVPRSWGWSDNCCTWERVTCNKNTRVSDLYLDSVYNILPIHENERPVIEPGCWNLNLTIFSSFQELEILDLSWNSACLQNFNALQNLKNLRELSLGSNQLNGSIPASIFELPQLEHLDLSGNLLLGHIPKINISRTLKSLRGRCLQYLDLSGNQLDGSIPAFLFELLSLEYLDLHGNFLQGDIPMTNLSRTLMNLRELQYLDLSRNQLDGSIPTSLFELPHIARMILSANQLTGSIPDFLFDLACLEYLDLQSNQLNGRIPSSLFELQHLHYLDLSRNLLQGLPISPCLNFSSSHRIINLSKNNLNGTFDFFWLHNSAEVKSIDLSGNADLAIDVKFRKSAPPFQLVALMLSRCNLDNGIITELNYLDTQRHLQILDLSSNNLTGSIPNWILANVPTLRYLNLANNSLAGPLDLMWQQQSDIQIFNISKNHFVGNLPTNMSTVFPELRVLDTSYNIISGDLPPSLCKIWKLEIVELSNNKLTGEVSACLFTTSIVILKLSNNKFGGPILGACSNFPTLEGIYLASNNFEGEVPNNLSGSNLKVIDVHDNKLSGKLDMASWNLSSLQVLSVARNRLIGEIDPTICKLTGLQFLDISDNNFGGSIPNCASKLVLKFLNMSSNALSGFPDVFLNSSDALVLDLRYNQFKGSLDWILHLSQIKMLMLGGNMFEGQICWDLCHLQYLNIIDLSQNKLSGSLPHCIGSISFGHDLDDLSFWSLPINIGFEVYLPTMTNGSSQDEYSVESSYTYELQGFTFSTKGGLYTYGRIFFNLMFGIDLSANMLSGEIPWEIGNLIHVKSLNLSHNFFTGTIPAALANMSAIESLDLSHNELSGPIPSQLAHLWSLEVFSVAYNNLTGCIPNTDQLASIINPESYMGNTNLHNLSEGNHCFLIPSNNEDDDMGEASEYTIIYIISAASFVLSFWASVAFLFCHPFGQRVVLKL